MRAWWGRFTETAVASLLAWVRAAWGSGRAVMSVLALDVSEVFDQMLKEQLTWALRQRGLPRAVYNWVFSFMSDRWTTLAFDGQESPAFPVMTGIPQGSPPPSPPSCSSSISQLMQTRPYKDQNKNRSSTCGEIPTSIIIKPCANSGSPDGCKTCGWGPLHYIHSRTRTRKNGQA